MKATFALAHLDWDGDHVEYVCNTTITRAQELCDQLNEDRHDKLEVVLIEVLE